VVKQVIYALSVALGEMANTRPVYAALRALDLSALTAAAAPFEDEFQKRKAAVMA
jgi:hypothetical protein